MAEQRGAGLSSLSLPSATRAARVSLTPSVLQDHHHTDVPQASGSSLIPNNHYRANNAVRTRRAGPAEVLPIASTRSRNGGQIQSSTILPSSAFLSPRKPSKSARSTASSSMSPNRSGDCSGYPASVISRHDEHPSADPSPQEARMSSYAQSQATSPSHSRKPSVSASITETIARHGRSGSLQNTIGSTIGSKGSQDPLIAVQHSDILPTVLESPNRPEATKRGSKTSSIGSLLGFNTSNFTRSASKVDNEKRWISQVRQNGQKIPDDPYSEKTTPQQPAMTAFPASPPQAFGSHYRSQTSAVKPLRNYQVYQANQRATKVALEKGKGKSNEEKQALGYGSRLTGGNTRFYLSGRLITSGDSPFPFLASVAVVILTPAAFLAFEASWLCDDNPPSATEGQSIGTSAGKAIVVLFVYTTLIMWSSMLRTALRDPGIIPKGLDPAPELETYVVSVGSPDDITGTGMGHRPRSRHTKVRDETVTEKWCGTCQTYRPPQTSHCRLCDVCTEQTDHHCSFLNNCIGRRNYTSFIAFLVSACFCGLFVVGVSAAHLCIRAKYAGAAAFLKDWRTAGSLAVAALVLAFVFPVFGLLCYHIRLIWLARTTIEMVSVRRVRYRRR